MFHVENCDFGRVLCYAKAEVSLLPLTFYALRWRIEVSYYEEKTFGSLGDYMMRSKVRIGGW